MQTIKERAKAAVKAWEDAGHADATETLEAVELLREIANAPEAEPVAYIEHHKGGDNLVWDNPGGKYSALYTAPPAPSVPDSKTLQFLTDVLTAAGLLRHGKKDAGLATRIADESFRIRQQLFTQPEQPADLGLDVDAIELGKKGGAE